jgi:hypothetical protein
MLTEQLENTKQFPSGIKEGALFTIPIIGDFLLIKNTMRYYRNANNNKTRNAKLILDATVISGKYSLVTLLYFGLEMVLS